MTLTVATTDVLSTIKNVEKVIIKDHTVQNKKKLVVNNETVLEIDIVNATNLFKSLSTKIDTDAHFSIIQDGKNYKVLPFSVENL